MLLKTSPSKTECKKETLLAEDGSEKLKINITYPTFAGRDKFSRSASDFYKRTADAFYDFAKNILSKKPSPPSGQPMAAVLKATVMLESKKYLSVLTEASVFDGESQNAFSRSSQLWAKKECNLLRWSDVFTSKALKAFPNADRRLFYADKNGITVLNKDGSASFLSFEQLKEQELLSSALTIG